MQNRRILVYENVHEDVCQILQNTGVGECVADIAECYYRKMCEVTLQFSGRKICELHFRILVNQRFSGRKICKLLSRILVYQINEDVR